VSRPTTKNIKKSISTPSLWPSVAFLSVQSFSPIPCNPIFPALHLYPHIPPGSYPSGLQLIHDPVEDSRSEASSHSRADLSTRKINRQPSSSVSTDVGHGVETKRGLSTGYHTPSEEEGLQTPLAGPPSP